MATPTPAAPKVSLGSKLDSILAEVEMITSVAEAIPFIGPFASLADKFLQIAQASVKAHNAATGQPIDLAQLHNIDPVP
jgi:hypothetical protein